MLQERQQRKVNTDTKEIFDRITNQAETLTYQQSLELLSDLAFMVVPFDKTLPPFQMLLARTKLLLQNQSGNVRMFELVEAVTRLNVDALNQVIRRKVEEGNYSRAPADLCALLYFFSSQHKLSKSQRDADLFITVVRDLHYMQTTGLQMEQIDLIVRALAHSCEPEFREQLMLHGIDEHSTAHDLYCREVEAFLPKLVE